MTSATVFHKRTIIREIAAGKLLIDLCARDDLPMLQTVQKWINEDVNFRRMFIQASVHGLQVLHAESINLPNEIKDHIHEDRDTVNAIKAYVGARQKAIESYSKVMQKVLSFLSSYDNMVDIDGNKIEDKNKDEGKVELDLMAFLNQPKSTKK